MCTVFLGGICSDVQSTTPESVISLSLSLPSLHPGFVFVQNKTDSRQSLLNMRAHLRNVPSMLYSSACPSAGVWLGVITSVIIIDGIFQTQIISYKKKRLSVGVPFPQWPVHSFQIHSVG